MNADPKLAGQTRRRSSWAARGDVKHNDVVSGCRRVSARRDAHTDQNAFAFSPSFFNQKRGTHHRWYQTKNQQKITFSNQSYGLELINVPGVWTTVSDCFELINYSDTNLMETES